MKGHETGSLPFETMYKNVLSIYLRNIWNVEQVIRYNLAWVSLCLINRDDSSILFTIISCDYLNLSLADEHVGDVTIPTQVIKYNQNFL